MSTPAKIVVILCVAAASFLAGAWWSRRGADARPAAGGRKILYYHDPMHPAYKSDKPGIAPDCGMQLAPVYADGGPAESSGKASLAPGTVQIGADKQQMIGVRVEEVRKGSGAHAVRVLGRVVADEGRIYKVNATIDGWIRQIRPVATTGSLVHKDETLATYNAPEFLGPMQAYLYALGAFDRFQATGKETESQIALTRANIQQAKNSLLVFGMSELQANEMARTRQLTEDIRIVAPAGGFIVARNISPGQRFEKGTEFFRIADLSHVWVLADLFENEARVAHSAAGAVVRYQGRVIPARVSGVPPIFDPNTRTLKTRLEVENPRSALRPDMFVDVEFQVGAAAGITVPADALLDSGLRKTVFVEREKGVFEPREVQTGARLRDRVVITKGLEAGDRIVVSGNFLIDSESRLQLAAAGLSMAAVKDPVCGMDVEPSQAVHKSTYEGKTYYFCNPSCKREFDKNPAKYVPKKKDEKGGNPEHSGHQASAAGGPAGGRV